MKTAILVLLALASIALAPSTASDQQPRFEFVDVFIDPHGEPLAAYQFELTVDSTAAQIVGVEGGEHAAFKNAPYYDPAALQQSRIVIAAFNTGSDIPAAKTRVARLHMRITTEPSYKTTLHTAATKNGEVIPAAVTIEQGPRL